MKAEIKANGAGFGSITLDGQDVGKGVAAFTLRAVPGDVLTLELDVVLIDGADIGADVNVVVPAETHDALVAIGWTPPGGA